jgi:hypothetical protein
MPKQDREKVMLVEHVLEVRHAASGTFLDVRGQIADYVRKENFLPHWKIDTNVVNFRDEQGKIKTEGAFVGYKSAGYVVLNSQTRNFFTDRGSAFWKLLLRNPTYHLPEPTRFGVRTKIFVPSMRDFDDINAAMFQGLFTDKARALFGGKERDLLFTIDLSDGGFDIRVIGGPIHKDEAPQYFQFESEDLKKCGLFLDIDYFKTSEVTLDAVPKLLHDAVSGMWIKAERIASGLGL